jgi:hypothetical protein
MRVLQAKLNELVAAWLCDSLSAQLLHQRPKCPLISPQMAIGPDLVFVSRPVWKALYGLWMSNVVRDGRDDGTELVLESAGVLP